MKISIKDIASLPDTSRKVPASFDKENFSYLGNGFTVIHTKPFDVAITMIGSSELNITFETIVTIGGVCDRCLENTSFDISIEADETLAVSEGEIVSDEDLGDFPFASGSEIDIDELIMNEIITDFPTKILCQEDCRGICPVCGKNRNVDACSCDDTVLDPRMAQFLDVFESFKEVK